MTPIQIVMYVLVWVLALGCALGWIKTYILYKGWRQAHEELCKTIKEFQKLADHDPRQDDEDDEDCKMGPEHGCSHPRHLNQPEP